MLLLRNIPHFLSSELESQAYFELFKALLKKYLQNDAQTLEHEFLVYLLENLTSAVHQHLQALKLPQFAQNELYLLNIDIGYAMNEAYELIFLLVKSQTKPLEVLKRRSQEFLKTIISDFLVVKRLSIIKNQQFSILEANLLAIFNEFSFEEAADKAALLKELTFALLSAQNDLLAEIFICEQMLSVIHPLKKKYSILLILEKKRSQEDYIKGSMKSNPYSAEDIGETFKQIRSKLYRDLELSNEFFYRIFSIEFFL